ncbi:hypothetical protein [Streptomyces yangpuensis]|uniref:hypothetical protein n=1 Tax=Streptomyces yangpuensis TaxID=1648182 RepID=UPI000628FCCA|nr:hypothetical protein [Streptomyces yangpuensis]
MALTAFLGSLLRSASTAATGALEPKVQRVATEQYLGLVHRTELSAIEDDEFHRLLDAARYGADSARRMIRYCTNTLNAAVSLIAAAGVLTFLYLLAGPSRFGQLPYERLAQARRGTRLAACSPTVTRHHQRYPQGY